MKMSYETTVVFKYSIIIAVIMGLVRYNRISRSYHPFIIIVVMGFFSELSSTITIAIYKSNAVPANIYYIVECLLWLWQFKRWGIGIKNKTVANALTVGLIVAWIVEMKVKGITQFCSIFPILYSFTLVFFAINQINKLIVEEKTNLLRNAKFMICVGVIIFYPYCILVESFYIFDIEESDGFLSNVYYILMYVNLFVNLLYALAVLWIPTRERFTLPSL